jgi:putative Mg2+ transporter-C (MgtC) family protein
MEEWLEILLKLLISLGASGLIGLERELTGHKAGIRTQILVGIGSTSLIMLGVYNDMEIDEIARIIAGIATGLGFLGAGAIIKEGLNVKGLTTAASIWVNAGIGAAIGLGSYMIGISAVIIALIVLSVFSFIERVLHLKLRGGTFEIAVSGGRKVVLDVLRYMERRGVTVKRTELEVSGDDHILRFDVDLRRRTRAFQLIGDIHRMEGIKEIRWEDADISNRKGVLFDLGD